MKIIKKMMMAMFALSVIGMAVSCGNRSDSDDDTKKGKAASELSDNSGDSESKDNQMSRQILAQALDEVNENLPMSVGMVGDLTKFAIEGNDLVMELTVNESAVNIDALRSNPELMHELVVSMATNSSNPALDVFLDLVDKADMGLKIVYVGKSSGKSVSSVLTSDEIKNRNVMDESQRDPEELLAKQIEVTNLQMPMELGYGMVMVKFQREGDYIVTYCECDESIIPIDALKENVAAMKSSLKSTMTSYASDPSVSELVRLCKDAGVGIKYKYIGKSSGKSVTVGLSADELE